MKIKRQLLNILTSGSRPDVRPDAWLHARPGALSEVRNGILGKSGQPRRGGASKEPDGRREFRLGPELFGLLCLLLAALVFISLTSHNPADPGFNHAVYGAAQIKNWAGIFGAYLSAFLIDFFGFAAYIPFLFLTVLGARLCVRGTAWPWWRWCAFVLLACCTAVAASVWNMGLGDVRSGGLLGRFLLEFSLRFFNPVGSTVIWSFLFLLVLQALLGFSWRELAARLAWHVREAFEAEAGQAEPHSPSTANSLKAGGAAAPRQESDGAMLLDSSAREASDGAIVPAKKTEGDGLAALVFSDHTAIDDIELPAAAAPVFVEKPEAAAPAASPAFAALAPKIGTLRENNAAQGGVGEALERLVAMAAERQARQQDLERHNASFHVGVPDDVKLPETAGKLPVFGSGGAAGKHLGGVATEGVASVGKFFRGLLAKVSKEPEASVPPVGSEDRPIRGSQAGPEPRPVAMVKSGPDTLSVQAEAFAKPGQATPSIPSTGNDQPPWLADLEAGRIGASALRQVPSTFAEPAEPAELEVSGGDPASPSEQPAAGFSRPRRLPLKLPPLDLLRPVGDAASMVSREELEVKGRALMTCLKDFSIQAELVHISPGPVVTSFEIRPAPGVKSSRISGLSDDMALSLKATSVRIQAPIPGTNTVGVEIPNEKREVVGLRELVAAPAFREAEPLLSMALGKDISGSPTIADLARMPHMLVAGATGTGKSVFLNAVLLSFLYRARPDELKLLLLDPKRIEMAVYADLPHLVHPIVTEMSLAKNALDWAVAEMERRYGDIARLGVRNVLSYNQKLREMGANRPAALADLEPMPYLVIIIDELADLMLTAGKEVETSIVRLAQLARAAGIHLIIATQRPSVDVVTGLIKANFPCRISFQVTSKHDSRTILDMVGAEHLLGRGDMLFKPSGGRLQRLHGAFVPDDDVAAVADYWRAQQKPDYQVDFAEWGQEAAEQSAGGSSGGDDVSKDPVYTEAVEFVREQGKASISLIQRRFRIGFNRAARYIEQMEQDGIIGPADGSRPRVVR